MSAIARETASVGATRAFVVLLAIAIVMVDGFDLQAIGIVAPEIARGWSLPISAFGPVFSAALAGSMLGAMVAGPVGRLIGMRSVLAICLAVFGGCTLLTAWVNDLKTLVALRFVTGLGLGAAVPVLMSIVAGNSPARWRATLVVATLCGQPIGAIVGGALCARFIPVYGWPFTFYLGGVLPLLLIVPVLVLPAATANSGGVGLPARSEASSNQGPERWCDLFGGQLRATTLLLWSCAFLGTFIVYIVVNWLPAFMRGDGHTLQTSVWAMSLFNGGGIAGALLLGSLMDRYGPFKVMPAFVALAAVTLAMLDASISSMGFLLPVTFMAGFAGYGAVMSLGSLTVMLYPPLLRATGAGWAMGMGRLGAALGPLGAGVAVAAGMAIGRLFYFAAVAATLIALCLTYLARVSAAQENTSRVAHP